MGHVVAFVTLRTYCGLRNSECGLDERFKVQGPYPMWNACLCVTARTQAELGRRNEPTVQGATFNVPSECGLRNAECLMSNVQGSMPGGGG